MAHVLGCTRARLLADAREPLAPAPRRRFDRLVARRASGEPLAHLVRSAGFLDLDLLVNPSVLVPRADTEILALWAIARARAAPPAPRVLDVGTGSGALAIAVAAAVPRAHVHGSDNSRSALAVARANARRMQVADRVRFHLADLLPSRPARFDVVMANLPYVGECEREEVDPEVLRFEPVGAVLAGPEGTEAIRRLLHRLPGRLASDGALGMEIGWRQGAAVSRLASDAFPGAEVTVLPDLAGRDRVVTVELVPGRGGGGGR